MASPFSGSSGRKAAVAVMDYLGKMQSDIDTRLSTGQNNSIGALNKNYQQALDTNNRAKALYDPYRTQGLAALGQYADATGQNGQEGHDRAVANFRAGPGYERQVEEATDAVARKASAMGVLGSGNTMAAITDRASHLADLEYDDYLDRLNGTVQLGYDATGRQAGILGDRAGLFTQRGRDKAGVYQGFTGMDINSRQRTASGVADALHGGMTAGENAASNRWNFAKNGLKGLASLAGSFG